MIYIFHNKKLYTLKRFEGVIVVERQWTIVFSYIMERASHNKWEDGAVRFVQKQRALLIGFI